MAKTKSTPRKPPGSAKLPCLKCSKTFTTIGSMKRHFQTHHSTTMTTYTCTWCNKNFHRQDSAKRHINKEHNTSQETGLIVEHKTPRELAEKVKPWIPPMEARRNIDWTKPPTFRIISKPTPQDKQEIDLAEDLYLSSDSEEEVPVEATTTHGFDSSQPSSSTTYTATKWTTAHQLSRYAYYEGLEEYRHLPGEYPNTEMYPVDTNHIIKSYTTKEYRTKNYKL